MKQLFALIFLISLLFAGELYAHEDIELISSSPSNNEMLMKSPDNLVLEFSKEVRLIKLTLSSSKDEKIKFGFKPEKSKAAKYQWAIPTLKPDTYKMSWSILGDDGHTMKGSQGFMVH